MIHSSQAGMNNVSARESCDLFATLARLRGAWQLKRFGYSYVSLIVPLLPPVVGTQSVALPYVTYDTTGSVPHGATTTSCDGA